MQQNFGTGYGESQNISSSAAAPNGVIATLSGLAVGGVYKIDGSIALTGTAETALTNLRLRTNGVNVTGGGVLPSVSAVVMPFSAARVTIGADGLLTVGTASAATAGSVYTVRMTATRIE